MLPNSNSILIVDDEVEFLELIKDRLETRHYEVVTANGGHEGFHKACSEKPDLILMDVMMPDINGLVAVAAIKKYEKTKHIPIIAISNKGQITSKEALSASCDSYSEKPTTLSEVRKLMERAGDLIVQT